MPTIAIVGPGAIGGILAAWLAQDPGNEVTVCARTAFDRLEVETPTGRIDARPRVLVDRTAARPVDWVLIATKAYDAVGAAAWLAGLRRADTPVVILREKEGSRVLPIWIGPAEASAIAMELQGMKAQRPLTHDLLKQVLVGLGGELRRVVISAVKENTYFAELMIRRDDHVFQVDARPSDSIALALRMRAPIFTSDQLLDQSGVETDEPPPDPSLEADKLKQYLEKMDPQDFGKFNP